MTEKRISLTTALDIDVQIDIVDIGANPIDGDAPYKSLLDDKIARIVGFEPNPEALARLQSIKGPNDLYLPNAVYDGTEQEIKFCQAPGMTSLLEPNLEVLEFFHGFPNWGKVISRDIIQTTRLDDVEKIKNIDYLKIDIQGAELEVFRNGVERLSDCLVIHTEVEFLEMYKGQPLFSEVELFLRDLGFVFHRFAPLGGRTVQPLVVNNNIFAPLSQILYADAVFIKDFTKFEKLDPKQLKKIAVILHDTYQSYDIALRALMVHDEKAGSTYAKTYKEAL